MPELEQIQQQQHLDGGSRLRGDDAEHKFVTEVYDRRHSGCLHNAGEKPEMKNNERKPNMSEKAAGNLEKEGNVEMLKLPGGFSKSHSDKSESFVQFDSESQKNTKVCYQRRGDFSADDEDNERITDVLKKPPHVLNEQETLDVMPMMAPGRPWGNGNYRDLSLSSADIDGRRVLVADFKSNEQDKRVHLIIANQDKNKHQIENLWLEAPGKDFDKNNKSVFDAFQQIKWTSKAEK